MARVLRYGFITLPREIGRAVLVGSLLSGVLGALVPPNFFADKLGTGVLSMLVAMGVGIPLYVCSTGSIPVAFAMLRMGLTPGAALVFLVTGPATNAASITTIWKILGRRELIIYLSAIAISALGAGFLLDAIALGPLADRVVQLHGQELGWVHHMWGVALLAVLGPSLFPSRRKGKETCGTGN